MSNLWWVSYHIYLLKKSFGPPPENQGGIQLWTSTLIIHTTIHTHNLVIFAIIWVVIGLIATRWSYCWWHKSWKKPHSVGNFSHGHSLGMPPTIKPTGHHNQNQANCYYVHTNRSTSNVVSSCYNLFFEGWSVHPLHDKVLWKCQYIEVFKMHTMWTMTVSPNYTKVIILVSEGKKRYLE